MNNFVQLVKNLNSHQINKNIILNLNETLRPIRRGVFKHATTYRYPKKYLNENAKTLIYLTDDRIAEAVVNHTKHSFLGKDGERDPKWVFDASPGDCALTRQFLKSGAHKVRVFEIFEERLQKLDKLKNEFPEQLDISDLSIIDFSTKNFKHTTLERAKLPSDCFRDIPIPDTWSKKDSNIRGRIVMYACLSPRIAREFFSYLAFSASSFDTYFLPGPTEFYLFAPLSVYKILLSKPGMREYRSGTVLFNTLFEYKALNLEVPGCETVEKIKFDKMKFTTFGPEHFVYYKNNSSFPITEPFVLLTVKPKPVLQEQDEEFCLNYFQFVKQVFSKRKIPAHEYFLKHFPDFSIELLGLGISCFKNMGDLNEDDMLKIFTHLYQTPRYKTSIFCSLNF